jgi:hypothetical protein
MMTTCRFAAVAALAVLTACAAGSDYRPAFGDGPGYAETALDALRWRVVYRGATRLDRAEVENRALLRAAELSLEQGRRWFRVVRLVSDAETRAAPLGAGVGVGVGPSRGNVGVGVGYDLGATTLRTRWTAIADIALLDGPLPGDPAVYDAADLAARLGPEIRGGG